MLICPSCGASTLYDEREHRSFCACGWKGDFLTPRKSRCFRCGEEYDEYTWFDPTGCPNCGTSFVE